VCGRTELVGPPLYPDCARRFLVEAFIMEDCDVKKIEKTLSERFSKLRLNSVSVLERGNLLYLIVSYCIFKLDRYSKDILRRSLGDWKLQQKCVCRCEWTVHWKLIYSVDNLMVRD
jgi:hypothetical protein